MQNNGPATPQQFKPPGVKHWLFQLLPPLIVLGCILSTREGPNLIFLTGVLFLPALVSAISIIGKLILFNKRKYFLFRPLLTIFALFGLITLAHHSYQSALAQTKIAAEQIQQTCQAQQQCPEHPSGWRDEGSTTRKYEFGTWIKYPAVYYTKTDVFEIRLYQGPDLGHIIEGGITTSIVVSPYQDG